MKGEKQNRHAYLIMAHNQFALLKKLLTVLDDPQNDIFLHIDKKVKCDRSELASTMKNSRLYFAESIKVIWGAILKLKPN